MAIGALIVGNAPPQRLYDQIQYQELVSRETNPVLDWRTVLSGS
jgi:hypothetical protein